MMGELWVSCHDRLPPVGAKVKARNRDGALEDEVVTVRRDHTGVWADPGYSCIIRYFDKDDHLTAWLLVEAAPAVPDGPSDDDSLYTELLHRFADILPADVPGAQPALLAATLEALYRLAQAEVKATRERNAQLVLRAKGAERDRDASRARATQAGEYVVALEEELAACYAERGYLPPGGCPGLDAVLWTAYIDAEHPVPGYVSTGGIMRLPPSVEARMKLPEVLWFAHRKDGVMIAIPESEARARAKEQAVKEQAAKAGEETK